MSYNKNVNAKVTAPLSQFGDLVVADLTAVLRFSFEYNTVNNTRLWTATETNGGTVSTAEAQAVINTSTTANSVAAIKSRRPAKYQSGFGSKIRFTARFSSPATSCVQIIGSFDETGSTTTFKNGYGIGYNGTTLQLIHYVNDTDSSINLSAADDPLDGNGSSGFTLDPTKINLYEIDYGYQGVGDIVYRVYSSSDKAFVDIHRVKTSNVSATPHSYNPNNRLWVYADNGATTSDVTTYAASMMYAIQGHTKFSEIQQPQEGYTGSASGVTTQTQVFSIRNKSTYTSVTNLVDLIIEAISVNFEGAGNARGTIKLALNPTLGGVASWTDISTTDSIAEYDTAQTTVSSEGTVLAVIYLSGQFDRVNMIDLINERLFLSPGDEIAVLASATGSSSFDVFLAWQELF